MWSCVVTSLVSIMQSGLLKKTAKPFPLVADVRVDVLARMLEVDVLRPEAEGLVARVGRGPPVVSLPVSGVRPVSWPVSQWGLRRCPSRRPVPPVDARATRMMG